MVHNEVCSTANNYLKIGIWFLIFSSVLIIVNFFLFLSPGGQPG